MSRGKLPFQLTLISAFMLGGMTVYETLKQTVFPGITVWESHLFTILFSSVSATVAAYFVLTRRRESEERYRTAIESSNDGVVMVDDNGYLYVNQKFLDMFGYASKEEVMGQPLTINVHPDDRERVAEAFRKRRRGEHVPSRYEFRGARKDGKQIVIEVSAAKTTYDNRSISLAYMRDITDRKRVEEEKLYSAKLQSALEMAGTVCHELNQPLQIISGYSDLLIMGGDEKGRAAEKIEAIKEQAVRMGAITRKLMGFSRYSTREYIGKTRIVDIEGAPDRTGS